MTQRHLGTAKLVAAVMTVALIAVTTVKIYATPIGSFRISLDAIQVTNAAGYEIRSDGKTRTLKINLHIGSDAQLGQYQVGQHFAAAQVVILDSTLSNTLGTYSFEQLTIESVRNTGDATESFLNEELVLSTKTVTFAAP